MKPTVYYTLKLRHEREASFISLMACRGQRLVRRCKTYDPVEVYEKTATSPFGFWLPKTCS